MVFGGSWGDIGQSAELGCLVSRLEIIWWDGKMGGGGARVESEGSPGKASERWEWAVEHHSQILLWAWEKSGAGQLDAVKVLAAYTEYTGCQSQKLIGKYYSAHSFRLVCTKHCQKQNLSIFLCLFPKSLIYWWFCPNYTMIVFRKLPN